MENVAALNWLWAFRLPSSREIFSAGFGRKITAVLLLIPLLLFTSGCPTAQQWFQIAGALLPIIGNTYLQFSGFAQHTASPAETALVQTLTTAGQDVLNQIGGPNGLISVYEANKSASTIVQINALMTQLKQNVNAFLTDAQIKNSAHFAEYSAFANALLSDIQDVINIIPIVTPATASHGQRIVQGPLPKVSLLKNVFEARLAALPK